MLLDKYLPQYDFSEVHHTQIFASAATVSTLLEELDVSESWIIRTLLRLRGFTFKKVTLKNFESKKFFELERIPEKEIIIGLIGQFWKPAGNLQSFKPDQFVFFNEPGFAKAVWNFEILEHAASPIVLRTTTRIACTDKSSRKKFSRYWFFIQPFSGIIRKEMLKAIKRKAERINAVVDH